VSAEVAQLVELAGPNLTAAVGAYGVAVLPRAENTAVDATANMGRRILEAVWRRRNDQGRAELEAAVQDAADGPADTDAAAAVRQQIKRALREDAELLAELARLLPPPDETVNVTASGERSIAAKTIGTAVTRDIMTIRP
jgi:hypothetical protein